MNIKTVKRYDPLRAERKRASLEHRFEQLDKICSSLAADLAWLEMDVLNLKIAIQRVLAKKGISLDDYLDETEEAFCPKCSGQLVWDEAYRCNDCGFSAVEVWQSLGG